MKKNFHLTSTQLILLSFLAAVLLGSGLLALPVSSATGTAVPYLDALFTATTSVCVTGLVTLPTVSTWSIFGQAVILLLIQIGGLGVITVLAGVMIGLRRRMGLRDRMLIQDAFNLNTLSGMVRFLKKVLWGTLVVEGTGALLSMLVFVPEYGLRGIWISIFHAVSAFCNAGIDIFSETSLCGYATDPLLLSVTSALIIIGGLGFPVWWDVLHAMSKLRQKGLRCLQTLTLHSKLVLSTTALLLAAGTAAFLLLEAQNPLTLQGRSWFDRLQLAFFQSVTTRTAGFAALPQENLSNASALVSLLLMFLGGSPAGTSGGVKTTTVAVLVLAALAAMRGEDEVSAFHRTIARQTVQKALAVVGVSFVTMVTSTLLLATVSDAAVIDLLYETVSATATVGLSRSLTPTLNAAGKLIIIATMYLGRVGPISLMVAFHTKQKQQNIVKNPTEEISVG